MITVHKRTARRVLAAMAAGGVLAGTGMAWAADAKAVPGQCGGGYVGGHGGQFCDTDPWPDGSFLHYERVCVFGICGHNTFRACHVPGGRVPTDNDPATPC